MLARGTHDLAADVRNVGQAKPSTQGLFGRRCRGANASGWAAATVACRVRACMALLPCCAGFNAAAGTNPAKALQVLLRPGPTPRRNVPTCGQPGLTCGITMTAAGSAPQGSTWPDSQLLHQYISCGSKRRAGAAGRQASKRPGCGTCGDTPGSARPTCSAGDFVRSACVLCAGRGRLAPLRMHCAGCSREAGTRADEAAP